MDAMERDNALSPAGEIVANAIVDAHSKGTGEWSYDLATAALAALADAGYELVELNGQSDRELWLEAEDGWLAARQMAFKLGEALRKHEPWHVALVAYDEWRAKGAFGPKGVNA